MRISTSVLACLLTAAAIPASVSTAPRGRELLTASLARDRQTSRTYFRTLRRDVRAPYPDKRRRTVAKLAELGTAEAWEYVIRALEDEEPEVADEAQIQLAGVENEAVLRSLLGKAGLRASDDWVRLRVAEAFGRLAISVDGVALGRALVPKNARFSRALLWSIERLARGGRLEGDRERLARSIEACLRRSLEPGMRAAALSALAATSADRARSKASDLIEDREPAVRCAALTVLAELEGEQALTRIRALCADRAREVRFAAIDALEHLRTRDCLALLVERLEEEDRSRVRLRLVSALQRLTGMKYRLDPRPWRLFLSKLPAGWKGKQTAPPAAAPERTTAFAGLPVVSDRVAFLFDFSGSLWEERADGRTRKQILDAKTREVLERLPPGTEFNLIPYTHEPIPWRDELVPNEPAWVRKAVSFFERCNATGQGNFFDAALLALSDPDVDTIVVITDGAPTGGHRWNLDLMVDLLVEENRYRRVAFDSILIEPPQGFEEGWSRLAERTGGRSIVVGFDTLE